MVWACNFKTSLHVGFKDFDNSLAKPFEPFENFQNSYAFSTPLDGSCHI